ncbi:MAG: VTT domain-containing protein [Candidatus Micrarchaeota archaeon]|nr:VTT domain-containing protein [Candidatus Micrarchaeota archaeon]
MEFKPGYALALAVLISVILIAANPLPYIQSHFYELGYAGAFLVMLVNNATVILPMPGLVSVFILGSVYNPFLLGICAGLGAGLGELTGYMAGYGASARLEKARKEKYGEVVKWVERHGFAAIFVLAAIPNPLFDVAGLVAGATKYRWWKFLIAAVLGNIVKATALALAGGNLAKLMGL